MIFLKGEGEHSAIELLLKEIKNRAATIPLPRARLSGLLKEYFKTWRVRKSTAGAGGLTLMLCLVNKKRKKVLIQWFE